MRGQYAAVPRLGDAAVTGTNISQLAGDGVSLGLFSSCLVFFFNLFSCDFFFPTPVCTQTGVVALPRFQVSELEILLEMRC